MNRINHNANEGDDANGDKAMTRQDPTRRTFLQASVLAGAAAIATPATARASSLGLRRTGGKVTVVLFQRGGADHLNIYAPTSDSHYATLRPTVGIAPPGSSTGTVGLAMDATFYEPAEVVSGILPGWSPAFTGFVDPRSEERRVGKEC